MPKQCSLPDGLVPVKSKFELDIVRFSLFINKPVTFDKFEKLLAAKHGLDFCFSIWYADPFDSDLLPINNDSNFDKALNVSRHLLRLFIKRKGEKLENIEISGTLKSKTKTHFLGGASKPQKSISDPRDFRQVSSIIDADILPKSYRRVRLSKNKHDKPLGFYIRDGHTFRVFPGDKYEKVYGVFISRLVPGGLAESTGLLAVNDEVLEVNGVDVTGKSLDQVTDMMIANLTNLIITVKPAAELEIIKSFSSAKSHCSNSLTESEEENDLLKIYQV